MPPVDWDSARRFVDHDAMVILADTKGQQSCQMLAATLNKDRSHPVAHAMDCDVTKPENVLAAVENAYNIYRQPVDIFYNNAAVKNLYSPNSSIVTTSFNSTMAVNVQSVVASIEYAGKVMRDKRGGVILCTGSPVGPHGDVVPSLYSISKAAVMGVVRAAAAELGGDGVRVNAISPHGVLGRLDMVVLKKMFPHANETDLEAIIRSCGPNNVKEIHMANAAVFLASEQGKGINGQNFVLNGEFTV